MILNDHIYPLFEKFVLKREKIKMNSIEFLAKVQDMYDKGLGKLCDGYAPYCKHLYLNNFAGLIAKSIKITPENEIALTSRYIYRPGEKELPVLKRWF